MGERSKRWRRIRQIGLAVAALAAVWYCAWLARPSLASDFGIIPFGHPPATQGAAPPTDQPSRPRKTRIFPRIVHFAAPHLSALQTEVVDLWSDVKTTPNLIPVQDQTRIHDVFVKVDTQTRPYLEPVLAFIKPPKNQIWYSFVPVVPYCERYKCPVNCGDDNGDKDDTGCGKPKFVAVVPEPKTWAMMGAGVAAVGVLLRRRRRSATGPALA
jgi:hypothetical protein